MAIFLFIHILLLSTISSKYLYRNYTAYLQQWRQIASTNPHLQQLDVNENGYQLPATNCIGKCQYPVFQYKTNSTEWAPTILLISGFHGNEPLGPHILLEYARRLTRGHIVFFPLSNPSGYAHKIREEYPSQIDTNRDFPYNSQECMKTSTSRIVDRIFRRWKIDLTVTIHQGGEELGWNWGTFLHANQVTADQPIYKEIAEGVVQRFNKGFFGTSILKLGQMNQIIYPAEGTFDDWAYAASWDPFNTIKRCNNFKFPQYPHQMHQGLVFILQSAPHNIQQSNLESEQQISQKPIESMTHGDYLSRNIKILESFVDVANPHLQVTSNIKQISISVIGCSTSKLFIRLNDRIYKSSVKGSLNKDFFPMVLMREEIGIGEDATSLRFFYEISCDTNWRDVGKTSFSRGRDYNGSIEVELSNKLPKEQSTFTILGVNINGITFLILVLAGVLVISIVVVRLMCRNKNRGDKLEQQHSIIKSQSSFRSSNQQIGQDSIQSGTIPN